MNILFSLGAFCVLTCAAYPIPEEWQGKIKSVNAFYAPNDTDPIEANGYPGIYLVSEQINLAVM